MSWPAHAEVDQTSNLEWAMGSMTTFWWPVGRWQGPQKRHLQIKIGKVSEYILMYLNVSDIKIEHMALWVTGEDHFQVNTSIHFIMS